MINARIQLALKSAEKWRKRTWQSVLLHIISHIVYSKKQQDLKEIVIEARDTAAGIFADDGYLRKLTEMNLSMTIP